MTAAQKTPIALTLNRASEKIVNDALQLTGKALPCSVVDNNNSIVTVKFETNGPFTLPKVTIPMFGPEYLRYPIKPGDLGMVISADAYLGGVSGLGGGVADITRDPGNLSALVFLPISNTAWQSVDITTVTAYAPNGVVLRDSGSNSTFVLTPTSITMMAPNQVKCTSGPTSLTLTPAGFTLTGPVGNIATTGGLTIQDSAHMTSPSIMNAAWSALVTWLNTHVHTSSTAGTPTSAPNTPFSGGSIAP